MKTKINSVEILTNIWPNDIGSICNPNIHVYLKLIKNNYF